MKNKCALLIGALAIISALLIIKPYKVSAVEMSQEIAHYIDLINGRDNPRGFWWSTWDSTNGRGGNYMEFVEGVASDYSWTVVDKKTSLTNEYQWIGRDYYVDNAYSTPYFNVNIVSNDNGYGLYYDDWEATNCMFAPYPNFYTSKVYLLELSSGLYSGTSHGNNTYYSNPLQFSGTLEECFIYLCNNVRNVGIYVDGVCYSNPNFPPMQYGIMNTNKGLKVNGADFSFYTSYTDNKFTIAYNYTLTNRDNSDSNLRIDAGDLLTFELYAKVPTKEFVDHYISENGLGDATPSIIIDVARTLKSSTNIINTPSIPTTTIYGLNYYGYNENDAVEYDDSYYNYQYGNDQNGILTFRVTSSNNSADSPNLLAQLVKYYGSEREAILGSAMGYIDYCRSYVVNISGLNWNVYNPYYTYFFQVKDESGRNVVRANSFEGTPQQFNTNDVENGDSIGDIYAPSTNQSDIENSYSGGITNSYNSVVNNYYYTSQSNQELLDYLYRYRDGGTQEDIQDAYGYLNSTIDSVSNVPVVLGKLFVGFFPTPVILLFNAMFIIFAVFIVIKIIRHLFL